MMTQNNECRGGRGGRGGGGRGGRGAMRGERGFSRSFADGPVQASSFIRPEQIVSPPKESAPPPKEFTSPPKEFTAPRKEFTSPPKEFTASPKKFTASPKKSTASPKKSTDRPISNAPVQVPSPIRMEHIVGPPKTCPVVSSKESATKRPIKPTIRYYF
uniref:Extensin-like n=1 Tax=Steinernema glaseri TaxID=37863 RepID=A0A1I7YEC8_9BILA